MSSSEEEMFEAASSDNESDEEDDKEELLNDKVKTAAVCKMKEKVIDRINSIFEADLGNLEKVNDLHRELIDKFDELDRKLNVANTETPSQLHKSLTTGDEIQHQIADIHNRKEDLSIHSNKVRETVRNFCVENEERLSELNVVRGVAEYWVWLTMVDNIATELVLVTETGTPMEMVTSFSNIKEINDSLAESRCHNLKQYVNKTTDYWRSTIKTKLVGEFEEALESFGWPFIQLGDKKTTLDAAKSVSLTELQDLVKSLIMMQDDHDEFSDNKEDNKVSHPMKLMLKPLRKRFKYHFLGSKTSNNPAKPEWFTTQLVLWATLHKTFLDANIQPVYDQLQLRIPAKLEFCYGLVCLAREKLGVDLPIVFNDDVLLAHTIDEAISLTRELISHLDYSSSHPSPLSPLTSPNVFSRWINMERKFAFEKLDKVLSEESAWQSEAGDNLVPAAAQSFLAVLLSVTERYKYLTHSQHRLEFLELQIQLLEDFRVRLVQLVRSANEEPLLSNFCPILCTVHHLVQVLSNWAETPFFLQLQYLKHNDEDDGMAGTVFDEVVNKFEYLMTDMISNIIDSVMFSIKAHSRHYRMEVKWFSMTSNVSDTVHPAFCHILQDIAFYLETVGKMVPSSVFSRLWSELAGVVGKFICEEVILVNSYSAGGGKQLHVDIHHGLLPIFGEFTTCPIAHFPVLMDCVKLLNTSSGSLMLALENLDSSQGEITLRDLGVSRLTVEQAEAVIRTRVDLQI